MASVVWIITRSRLSERVRWSSFALTHVASITSTQPKTEGSHSSSSTKRVMARTPLVRARPNCTTCDSFEKRNSFSHPSPPSGIALEAINYARNSRIDVVLVDTAGRMQDNEPLMRALSKLIAVNDPDLVLFVGEFRWRRRK